MTRANKAKTKRFMITKIDADLWRKFKSACAHYDLSMKDLFIGLITNIVDDYEKRPGAKHPPIFNPIKQPKKKC